WGMARTAFVEVDRRLNSTSAGSRQTSRRSKRGRPSRATIALISILTSGLGAEIRDSAALAPATARARHARLVSADEKTPRFRRAGADARLNHTDPHARRCTGR